MSRASEPAPSVELHLHDRQTTLSAAGKQQLAQEALQLVKSSNFHSGPGDKYHFFTLTGVQNDYRREVAGKYLLVSFSTARAIKTTGGDVTVSEVVIGLNRNDYASSLFTIDGTGRVVAHTKYSGERCIEIFKTIKQLTDEASS